MTKEDYKGLYFDALIRIKEELIKEGVDVSDGTAVTYRFDETANAEEVVGYYVFNEGDNALRQWENNIEGLNLSEQDCKVTRLLEELYDNKQILQFSIDVEGSDETTEAAIRELLELAGINVVGISWRAAWKNYRDYENGVCYSWD